MSNNRNGPATSGLTASVSLVVSAAIAYAIETGLVGWSWWWLALTGAPFVVYVAALAVALVGLVGIASAVSVIGAMIRRER